jgi:hypothetical protein
LTILPSTTSERLIKPVPKLSTVTLGKEIKSSPALDKMIKRIIVNFAHIKAWVDITTGKCLHSLMMYQVNKLQH